MACSQCGAENRTDAKFCARCGGVIARADEATIQRRSDTLAMPPTATMSSAATTQRGMLTACVACGSARPVDEPVCGACGHGATIVTTRTSHGGRVAVVAGFLALAVAAVVLVIVWPKGGTEPASTIDRPDVIVGEPEANDPDANTPAVVAPAPTTPGAAASPLASTVPVATAPAKATVPPSTPVVPVATTPPAAVATVPPATIGPVPGDLLIPGRAMSRPLCDGQFIVMVANATNPLTYYQAVSTELAEYPGSSYLRTDQTCPSLRQADAEGDAIYSVYYGPYASLAAACADRVLGPTDAYVRKLSTESPSAAEVDCP